MTRKQKPLHQQAREKGLTPNDSHELQLFREFLRTPGSRLAAYERVYGKKDQPRCGSGCREPSRKGASR